MDTRSISLDPARISFDSNSTRPSSSGRTNFFFKPGISSSNHHRSTSLSGLVKRRSSRRNSSLPTGAAYQNNTNATPELTSILSRGHASTEVQGRDTSNNISASHRHSISNNNNNNNNSTSSQVPQTFHINTLPIIQPRPSSNWNIPYELDRRSFRVSLNNPRQQVTSLLALSSVPRPLSPPFNEEFESSASVILAATRTAIEEEAIQAAIAASLQPELDYAPHQFHQQPTIPHHWPDHPQPQAIAGPRRIQ